MAQELLPQGIPFLFSSGYSTVGLPPKYSDRPFLVKPFDERELGPMAAGLLRPNPATMGSALAPEVLSAIGLQLQSAAVFATRAFGRTCEASATRPLALPFPRGPARAGLLAAGFYAQGLLPERGCAWPLALACSVASRDVNDEGGVGPGYIAGAAPFPPLILAAMDEPLRSVRVFREYVVDG